MLIIIQEINKSIKDSLTNSSLNSFTKVSKSKFIVIRLMWSVFLLIAIVACYCLVQKTVKDYLSLDVVSKVNIEYRDKMIMPVVTICNLNPSTKKINETIMFCDKRHNYGEFCDFKEDFEIYEDFIYGNCFRYNSGKNMNGNLVPFKYTYLNGFGIHFILYTSHSNESFENGFSIFISNYSVTAYSMEGVRLMPGSKALISIDKYSIRKKPYPYSNCIGDLTSVNAHPSELFQKTFSIKQTYHQLDCHFMCLQKLLGECSCQYINDDLIFYKEMPDCMNSESNKTCFNQNLKLFYKDFGVRDECDCPVECEISGYTNSVSFSDFLTEKSIKELSEMKSIQIMFPNESERNYKNFKRTLIELEIFHGELRDTITTQEAKMSQTDLISGFGGIVGLCMGWSLLSFVEIFEILFQTFIILFQRVVLKKPNNSKRKHKRRVIRKYLIENI